MISFTIPGRPITKKNHQKIAVNRKTGKPFIRQSTAYTAYEEAAGYFIPCKHRRIDYPVNICCVYYMPDHCRVDLTNLLEATDDILVKYGVLADDNCNIVCSHDGSRVRYDKENPRVEIEIRESGSMTSKEIDKAMQNQTPVMYRGIRYAKIQEYVLWYDDRRCRRLSAGLLDQNGKCLVRVPAEDVEAVT